MIAKEKNYAERMRVEGRGGGEGRVTEKGREGRENIEKVRELVLGTMASEVLAKKMIAES